MGSAMMWDGNKVIPSASPPMIASAFVAGFHSVDMAFTRRESGGFSFRLDLLDILRGSITFFCRDFERFLVLALGIGSFSASFAGSMTCDVSP